MTRNRLQWLNTMVTEPYYLFHFLTFFSYLPIRITAAYPLLSPDSSLRLLRREAQVLLAFAVLTAVKITREERWEGFMADTFFFGKVFLFVLALFSGYHLALWYVMVFIVIYILAQQPAIQELGDSNSLTPLQLERTLIEGETSRFWLVEFRALYSSACVRTSRIMPELSITTKIEEDMYSIKEVKHPSMFWPNGWDDLPSNGRYSNKDLSFGIVDLGLFPNTAGKFGISLAGGMGLPIYILFDGNVELARIPEVELEVEGSCPPITKKLLTRYFELDRRLMDYVNEK